MNRKSRHWLAVIFLIGFTLLWVGPTAASTLYFDMNGAVVQVGDVFNANLVVELDSDSVGFNSLELEIDDVGFKDYLQLDCGSVQWDSGFESYITGLGSDADDLLRLLNVYTWQDISIDISKGSAPIISYSGPILNMTFTAIAEGTAYLDAENDVVFQSYSEYTLPYFDGSGYHPGTYTRSTEETFFPAAIHVGSKAVPEPATLLLLSAGAVVFSGIRRKRMNR